MADLKPFVLQHPNTCTKCGAPISEGFAPNVDVANSGGALCAKCAGVKPEPTAAPAITKGKG
jgi:hypothetical protein